MGILLSNDGQQQKELIPSTGVVNNCYQKKAATDGNRQRANNIDMDMCEDIIQNRNITEG